MEITLDLDPEAYRKAESLAAERGQSIGKIIGDALLGRPTGVLSTYPSVVKAPTGLPEIRFGRPTTLEEIREAVEDED